MCFDCFILWNVRQNKLSILNLCYSNAKWKLSVVLCRINRLARNICWYLVKLGFVNPKSTTGHLITTCTQRQFTEAHIRKYCELWFVSPHWATTSSLRVHSAAESHLNSLLCFSVYMWKQSHSLQCRQQKIVIFYSFLLLVFYITDSIWPHSLELAFRVKYHSNSYALLLFYYYVLVAQSSVTLCTKISGRIIFQGAIFNFISLSTFQSLHHFILTWVKKVDSVLKCLP